MLTAWGDESLSSAARDPGTYILAAALSLDENLEKIRTTMEDTRLRTERKMHWRADAPARHRQVISTIRSLPVEGFVVVRTAQGDRTERSRRKCLEALLRELDALGCTALTLESRGRPDDARDLAHVRRLQRGRCPGANVPLYHEVGPKQPMLWVADAPAVP